MKESKFESAGPEDFPGSDEDSHFMAQERARPGRGAEPKFRAEKFVLSSETAKYFREHSLRLSSVVENADGSVHLFFEPDEPDESEARHEGGCECDPFGDSFMCTSDCKNLCEGCRRAKPEAT